MYNTCAMRPIATDTHDFPSLRREGKFFANFEEHLPYGPKEDEVQEEIKLLPRDNRFPSYGDFVIAG